MIETTTRTRLARRLTALAILAATGLAPLAASTMPAHAAQAAGGDITISAGAKGSTTGHTVKWVRIASYADPTWDKDGNPTGLDLADSLDTAGQARLKAAVARIDPAYDQNAQAAYTPAQWIGLKWKATGTDKYANPLADDTRLAALARLLGSTAQADAPYSLADHLTDQGMTRDDQAHTITVPVDYGTDKDTNLGGLYLIVDQNPTDTARRSNTMIVPSAIQKPDGTTANTLNGQTLGRVNMKNQQITVTKQRSDTLPTIGSQVTFGIDTTGPDYTNIDQPVLTIWDDPSDGVDQPTADRIKVTVDGHDYPAAGTDPKDINWTLDLKSGKPGDNPDAKDPNAFAIHMARPLDLQGKPIHVEYTATINANALNRNTDAGSDDTYANTATLEYSNDPYSTSTGKPHDTVQGPIAGLDIHKVELGDDTKDLTGARFTIAKTTDPNDPTKDTPVTFHTATIDGQQTWIVDPAGKDTTIGADDLSRIAVEGLDRGTYRITETQAPAGHVLGQGDRQLKFTVTVTADPSTHDRQDVHLTHDAGAFAKFVATDPADQTGATTLVRNATSLTQLPATGATGILIAAGALLVLALGGTLTATSRRLRTTTK